MSQNGLTTIVPSTHTGTDLANFLNDWKLDIWSTNRGTSRPTYLTAGGIWVDTTNTPNEEIKIYDGTQDHIIGIFNATANTYTTSGGSVVTNPDGKQTITLPDVASTPLEIDASATNADQAITVNDGTDDTFTVDKDGSAYFAGDIGIRTPVDANAHAIILQTTKDQGFRNAIRATAPSNAIGVQSDVQDTHATPDTVKLFRGADGNAERFSVKGDGSGYFANTITVNTTNYTSDPRLKTSFTPSTTTLTEFRLIEVGEFEYLDDMGNVRIGFNADSVRTYSEKCGPLRDEPVPDHYDTYYDDDVDGDGNPIKVRNATPLDDAHAIKTVDAGAMMAEMVRMIHLLTDKLAAAEADIAALDLRITALENP